MLYEDDDPFNYWMSVCTAASLDLH